ncbi:hypothetical protein ACJX0J_033197, partial [Zea mays]
TCVILLLTFIFNVPIFVCSVITDERLAGKRKKFVLVGGFGQASDIETIYIYNWKIIHGGWFGKIFALVVNANAKQASRGVLEKINNNYIKKYQESRGVLEINNNYIKNSAKRAKKNKQ